MVLYKILLQSAGLSLREAARFHGVSYDSIKDWSYGRRGCPDGVLYELSELIDKQNAAAHASLDLMESAIEDGAELELGFCADDHEAAGLGWPCKSAHDAVIRRVFEYADEEIREAIIIVPRGTTTASAAAIDAHN